MREVCSDNPVTVELLSAQDAQSASVLIRQVIATTRYYNVRARREETEKYTRESLRASTAKDPHSVIVAKVAGEVVGFCLSKYDDGLVWLSWFGVHPDWRRRGIGTALLRALERTARTRRCHKLWCDCRASNKESKSVLSQFGFRRICSVKNHWYGQDFILWDRPVR